MRDDEDDGNGTVFPPTSTFATDQREGREKGREEEEKARLGKISDNIFRRRRRRQQ